MPSKSAKGKKDPCASAHSPPGLPWACRCRGCRPGRMPRSTRQRRCRSERGTAARHGQHRRGTAGAVWQWPHARAGRGRADRWPAGCRQATASSWQVGGPGGPAPHSLPAPPDCSPFCAGPPPPKSCSEAQLACDWQPACDAHHALLGQGAARHEGHRLTQHLNVHLPVCSRRGSGTPGWACASRAGDTRRQRGYPGCSARCRRGREPPATRFKMHSKPRPSLQAAPLPQPHRPRLTLVRAGEGSAVGVGRVGVAR